MNGGGQGLGLARLPAQKSLGQHFLLDMNITRKIVRAAGDLAGRTVIEIGPGPGGLTRALLESPARAVLAIEKDSRFVEALQPMATESLGRLTIIEGDAMSLDPATLGTAPRVIVANLPYNVGTPLLVAWLKNITDYESLTLMFQKEVAERITASVGTSGYGRLSVIAQAVAQVQRVASVPARAFTPPPKVDSAVVHLRPLPDAASVPLDMLERVTQAAFHQRRKMLRHSLRNLGGEELLAKLGLDPTWRAENVPVSSYIALARILVTPKR